MNKRVGEEKINNQGIKMQIINYRHADDIDVIFEDGFLKQHSTYRHFKNGNIANPYFRSVLKVGYIGEGRHKTRQGEKHTDEYEIWRKMLTRCYDPKYHVFRPTYKECSVCDEWHNFQCFAVWYKENHYHIGDERMELDKDMLLKGNKMYAPDRCIFVPQKINNLLNTHHKGRGDYPIGVHLGKRDKRFLARCHDANGNLIRLGRFDTPEQAFHAYKEFKENVIKFLADQYCTVIPEKLYNALVNYKVEISD